jgi:hypothetical protein
VRKAFLQTGADSGGVHKGKHALQAFIGRPDQKAFGTVKIHHTGSRGFNAHLLFQRADADMIELAGIARGVRQVFGDDKQRNAVSDVSRLASIVIDHDDMINGWLFSFRQPTTVDVGHRPTIQ